MQDLGKSSKSFYTDEVQLIPENGSTAPVDVERSFSVYEVVLTENGKRFSSDDLYHHLVLA